MGLFGCLYPSKNNAPADDPAGAHAVVITADDVPEMTLRELDRATRSFSDTMRIGEGSYAAVYLAMIAMQCLQTRPASRPSMATVAREIEFGVVQEDMAGGEGCSGTALQESGSAE
ncbi:hypothetical protein EJB05_22173, partial [Eragrostis curvula]